MFCPKCGKELPNDSAFCPACGNKLSRGADEPEQQYQYDRYDQYEQPEQYEQYGTINGDIYAPPEPPASQKRFRFLIPAVICSVCCVCMAAMVAAIVLTRGSVKTDSADENSAPQTQTAAAAQTEQSSQPEQTEQPQTEQTEEKTTAQTTAPQTKPATTTTQDKYKIPVTPDSTSYVGTMYVATKKDPLTMRIGPGYKYAYKTEIPRRYELAVYAERSGDGETWAYVEYNGVYGWCTEKYLSYSLPIEYDIVEPDNYIEDEYHPHFTVVVNDLTLRKGPDKSYAAMDSIDSGTSMEEYGYNDDDNGKWIYTEYKGQRGWVMAYKGEYDSSDYKAYVQYEGGAAKPVIYLYPQRPTDVSVKLTAKNAEISTTYPAYGDGWNVTAYPDGKLVNKADGGNYHYLFWDSVNDRAHYDMSQGFVVKGEDTEKFLREKLEILGLNEDERNEFIVYWLPRMEHNKYNQIAFQSDIYTDNYELDISPKPDSLLRVFMTYRPLEEKIDIPEQKLSGFERKGFAAVEWGGAELK